MDVSGVHGDDDDVIHRIDVHIVSAWLEVRAKTLPIFSRNGVFPNGYPHISSANSEFMVTIMIARIYSA